MSPDTTVAEWGRQPAIRIPKRIEKEAGLTIGTPVHMEVLPDGGVQVVPIRFARPDMKELVASARKEIARAKAAGIDPYELDDDEQAWDSMPPMGEEV